MKKELPLYKTPLNAHLWPKDYEVVDDKRLVETAGYQSAQEKIEMILDAGRRLMIDRGGYDFQGYEIEEDFTDPTRDPNFDMADATRLIHEVEERKARYGDPKSKDQNSNDEFTQDEDQPKKAKKTKSSEKEHEEKSEKSE